MKKIFIYIISAVLSLSISFSIIPTASADMNPQTYQFISEFLLQLASIYLSSSSTQSQKTEALNTFNQIWRSSYDGSRAVRLSVDELYDLSSNLAQAGWQNHIVSVTNISDPYFSNSSVCWVIRGDGANVTEWIDDGIHVESIPSVFVFSGDYLCNQNGYIFYADPYISSSYFWDGFSSFVQGISSKLTTTNQKLDNILSAISGGSGGSQYVYEAHTQIEQMASITSSASSMITSGSDFNFLRDCFRLGTGSYPYSRRAYVSYEALSNLATELLDAGFSVTVGQINGFTGYYILDMGTYAVNPKTHAQVWSPYTAGVAQGAFALANGLYICALYDQGLLLNDLNLRIETVFYSIQNGFSSVESSLSEANGYLSDIDQFCQWLKNRPEEHMPEVYVNNVYAPGSSFRTVPYDAMVQMLSDINVNFLGYPCTVLGAGDGFTITSASMTSSFNVPEDDYYSLIVRYYDGYTEQVGRLCDASGNMFRAYQKDNYLFRILNKLDDIYNWLDNADLLTGEDIETMISNTNSKVLQFLPFSNNFIQMLNNVFPASPSLDWAGMNNYLQTVGRDVE